MTEGKTKVGSEAGKGKDHSGALRMCSGLSSGMGRKYPTQGAHALVGCGGAEMQRCWDAEGLAPPLGLCSLSLTVVKGEKLARITREAGGISFPPYSLPLSQMYLHGGLWVPSEVQIRLLRDSDSLAQQRFLCLSSNSLPKGRRTSKEGWGQWHKG